MPNWMNNIYYARRGTSPNTRIFTAEDFFELMPQFQKVETEEIEDDDGNKIIQKIRKSLIPEKILDLFVNMANKNILECVWFEKWDYACALYIAHYVAMYLKTYKDSSETPEDASNSGIGGNISSTSLGDASISYDNSSISTLAQKWGVWASTLYGQQLVTEAKLNGIGGAYFI